MLRKTSIKKNEFLPLSATLAKSGPLNFQRLLSTLFLVHISDILVRTLFLFHWTKFKQAEPIINLNVIDDAGVNRVEKAYQCKVYTPMRSQIASNPRVYL